MKSGRAAAGLAGLSVAWAVWLVATPVAASALQNRAAMVAAALTYRTGALLCHQQPARSFHVAQTQLPVCARCMGLYGGAALGGLVGLIWIRRRVAQSVPVPTLRLVLIGAAVPTAGLFAAEHLLGALVSNLARCAGAVPLGIAVGWFVIGWAGGDPIGDSATNSAIH